MVHTAPIQKFALDLLRSYFETYGLKGLEDIRDMIYPILHERAQSKFWIIEYSTWMNMYQYAELMGPDFHRYYADTFEVDRGLRQLLYTMDRLRQDYRYKDDGSIHQREILLIVLGKILQVLFEHLENAPTDGYIIGQTRVWLEAMPIRFERKLSCESHRFLCQLATKFPNVVLGDKDDQLKTALASILAIYRSEYTERDIDQLIVGIFDSLHKQQRLQKVSTALENSLPAEDKPKLKQILESLKT